MKKFYYFIILYITISCSFLYLLDFIISSNLKNSGEVIHKYWNQIQCDSIQYDVIVLGSSEVVFGIDPKILSDSLKTNVLDLAINSEYVDRFMNLYTYYCKFHSRPKILLINISYHFFIETTDRIQIEQYFPLFWDKTFRDIVIDDLPINWRESYIPMYRYLGYNSEIQCGLKINQFPENDITINGYIPQDKKYSERKYSYKFTKNNFLIKKFNLFVKTQKQNGTEVIFVYIPVFENGYKQLRDKQKMYEIFENIAITYNIHTFNYLDSKMKNNKTYFYDDLHLNFKGSKYFSKILGHDLKSHIDSLN